MGRQSPLEDGTLSMRQKALLKRDITKEHLSNLKAGYVSIHEASLHKTGIRGRKTYLFWALVGFLLILALGNLIVTCFLLGVLRLANGMKNLELLPDENIIKFYGDIDLNMTIKRDGLLEAFAEDGMTIESQEGEVHLVFSNSSEAIHMDPIKTQVDNVNSFVVYDPETGEEIFSTDYPNFGLPKGVKQINIKQAIARSISSPVGSNLEFKSPSKLRLKGNEGTKMDSKNMIVTAMTDLFLKAVEGAIVLEAYDGVRIDVKNVNLARSSPTDEAQFQLCLCATTGQIFRVPIPLNNARRTEKITCESAILHDNICDEK
ncbi:unnamed protein product [Darwinula stevensoni]|uniref:Beta-sarcoglycan n=1 Tax=Darwinula stevensoni TaxID=69355 RepID=A0A7R8ZYT0_9CRUS|nr:unnamed protein product [Darwinula stevensoni]CAG0882131.1 unnamed protein product [Darwinula stevensoni]